MNEEQMDITTPEHVSLRFKIAGLGSRAAAHIIDWLIIGIINSSLAFGYVLIAKDNFFNEGLNYVQAILIIVMFFLWWSYFILFEFLATGRTPGKMLIGLRVIQDNGQSVTFLSAFLRNLLRIIDLLPILYLLGMIMIFFNAKHKRIGDLVAGTIVIFEKNRRGKRKKDSVEKELEKKNITRNHIVLDEWSKKRISSREWNLLKTYVNRRPALKLKEREELTMKVAEILLPLIGIDVSSKSFIEVENDLLVLYLILKEEWEYQF